LGIERVSFSREEERRERGDEVTVDCENKEEWWSWQ
jgi:hypothetical protein